MDDIIVIVTRDLLETLVDVGHGGVIAVPHEETLWKGVEPAQEAIDVFLHVVILVSLFGQLRS